MVYEAQSTRTVAVPEQVIGTLASVTTVQWANLALASDYARENESVGWRMGKVGQTAILAFEEQAMAPGLSALHGTPEHSWPFGYSRSMPYRPHRQSPAWPLSYIQQRKRLHNPPK